MTSRPSAQLAVQAQDATHCHCGADSDSGEAADRVEGPLSLGTIDSP